MGNHNALNTVSERISNLISGSLEEVIVHLMRTPGGAGGPPAWFELCCQASLAAMRTAAPIIANVERKERKEEISKEFAAAQHNKAMCPEVLIFAALHSANILADGRVTVDGDELETKIHTENGPEQLWQTLQMWEKIFPDKRAEDYLENNMVEAARNAGLAINAPIDLSHGSMLFRGNGTIN